MSAVVWVPSDAAALSVGAGDVAAALSASGVTVRRNGSRGMLWLEPLVEVETGAGRVGYPNVTPESVGSVLEGSVSRSVWSRSMSGWFGSTGSRSPG